MLQVLTPVGLEIRSRSGSSLSDPGVQACVGRTQRVYSIQVVAVFRPVSTSIRDFDIATTPYRTRALRALDTGLNACAVQGTPASTSCLDRCWRTAPLRRLVVIGGCLVQSLSCVRLAVAGWLVLEVSRLSYQPVLVLQGQGDWIQSLSIRCPGNLIRAWLSEREVVPWGRWGWTEPLRRPPLVCLRLPSSPVLRGVRKICVMLVAGIFGL